MTAAPPAWVGLVEDLRPHLSPEWLRHAGEDADQGWMRLVLMVDAHDLLSRPRVAEKVAMTMADLSVEGSAQQEGWRRVQDGARDARIDTVARLVDAAETVLPVELLPLFVRSIEPMAPG